jgi:hypothetical protein
MIHCDRIGVLTAMTQLTPDQIGILCDGLEHAFPEMFKLDKFLYTVLGKILSQYAAPTDPLQYAYYRLARSAAAEGWAGDLIDKVSVQFPHNPKIAQLSSQLTSSILTPLEPKRHSGAGNGVVPKVDGAPVVNDLIRIIHKVPEALVRLGKQTDMERMPPILDKTQLAEGEIEAAARWLAEQKLSNIMKACYAAYSEVCKLRELKEQKVLEELAQRLVPALYPFEDAHAYADIPKIKEALERKERGLVVLSVYHPAVAEMAVAAGEDCATSYIARKGETDWPIGAQSLPDHRPDSGFDENKSTRLNNLKEQISKPFVASGHDEFKRNLRELISGKPYFIPKEGVSPSLPYRFRQACENIARLAKKRERRFYIMFTLPERENEGEALKKLINELGKEDMLTKDGKAANLDGLLFLGLSSNEEVAEPENDFFWPFIWMLPIEGKE